MINEQEMDELTDLFTKLTITDNQTLKDVACKLLQIPPKRLNALKDFMEGLISLDKQGE